MYKDVKHYQRLILESLDSESSSTLCFSIRFWLWSNRPSFISCYSNAFGKHTFVQKVDIHFLLVGSVLVKSNKEYFGKKLQDCILFTNLKGLKNRGEKNNEEYKEYSTPRMRFQNWSPKSLGRQKGHQNMIVYKLRKIMLYSRLGKGTFHRTSPWQVEWVYITQTFHLCDI